MEITKEKKLEVIENIKYYFYYTCGRTTYLCIRLIPYKIGGTREEVRMIRDSLRNLEVSIDNDGYYIITDNDKEYRFHI